MPSTADSLRAAKTTTMRVRVKRMWKSPAPVNHPCPAVSIAEAVVQSGAAPFIKAIK
jgi:hypothetical protein